MSMKWIKLQNETQVLEMNINYNPYPFYEDFLEDGALSKLDRGWTSVSIKLSGNGKKQYCSKYMEVLRTEEVEKIKTTLHDYLDGLIPEDRELSFKEPDLRFSFSRGGIQIKMHETEIIDRKAQITGKQYSFLLDSGNAYHLFLYLSCISGERASNNPEIKERMDKGIFYDAWIWYLTGKIGKRTVYIRPVRYWYHDAEEHCIDAYCKWYKKDRYFKYPVYWGYIRDFDMEKCYVPKILYQSYWNDCWGNTDRDRQMIQQYLEILRTEDLEYSDAIERLAAVHRE